MEQTTAFVDLGLGEIGLGRSVLIAFKFDVAAQRQNSDPPTHACLRGPSEKLWTKANRKRLDLDLEPTRDLVVTKFVHKNHEAQNRHKGRETDCYAAYIF